MNSSCARAAHVLSNGEITGCLTHLKQVARQESVPFYINAYFMIGYPDFVLRNGRSVPGERDSERDETYRLVLELRDSGAADFVHLSVLIPLPGTEMWDHLDINQRMRILLAHIGPHHPYAQILSDIESEIAARADRSGEIRATARRRRLRSGSVSTSCRPGANGSAQRL